MANTFIDAMNKGYRTAIPDLNVTAVDATDPYARHERAKLEVRMFVV